MKSDAVAILATVIVGLSLAACGSTENPPLTRIGEAVSAIEVRNHNEDPITDLRIGVCGQTFGAGPDYGWDRLNGTQVSPGASMRFPASPGCYNLAATTSSGGALFGRAREHFGAVTVTEDEPGVWAVR